MAVTVEAVQIPSLRTSTAALTTSAALLAVACTGCGAPSHPAHSGSSSTLVTPTTQIAGAGVLGNDRKPEESCAREPAALDPGPPVREIRNAAGSSPEVSRVPADPQRVVALSEDQLDALCALGLQARVVGAALTDGQSTQPRYLGEVIHRAPTVGNRFSPDLAAIKAAHPDVVLASAGLPEALYSPLAEIAPTVFTAAPGAAWKDTLRIVGAAMGRSSAADAAIDAFTRRAADIGSKHDATHFQASIVQLTASTMRIYGADNFPADVVRTVGLDRPASQRFTDNPYVEIATSDADLGHKPDFSAADADIIYVSCDSPAATQRATAIFDSSAWIALSAYRDNRVFVVDDEIWHQGGGVIAARGIVDDLRWVDAPIN